MAYHDNTEHKKVIDCVLRRNAMLFANLGSDSSKEDYEKASQLELQRLKRIRHLDPDRIDTLIRATE